MKKALIGVLGIIVGSYAFNICGTNLNIGETVNPTKMQKDGWIQAVYDTQNISYTKHKGISKCVFKTDKNNKVMYVKTTIKTKNPTIPAEKLNQGNFLIGSIVYKNGEKYAKTYAEFHKSLMKHIKTLRILKATYTNSKMELRNTEMCINYGKNCVTKIEITPYKAHTPNKYEKLFNSQINHILKSQHIK